MRAPCEAVLRRQKPGSGRSERRPQGGCQVWGQGETHVPSTKRPCGEAAQEGLPSPLSALSARFRPSLGRLRSLPSGESLESHPQKEQDDRKDDARFRGEVERLDDHRRPDD